MGVSRGEQHRIVILHHSNSTALSEYEHKMQLCIAHGPRQASCSGRSESVLDRPGDGGFCAAFFEEEGSGRVWQSGLVSGNGGQVQRVMGLAGVILVLFLRVKTFRCQD